VCRRRIYEERDDGGADMSDTVLVIRTCGPDMTSYGGFRWPVSGPVEAPDWDPTPECGHGLHGLLWGVGEGALLDWSPEATWLVVEVDADVIVDLGGKVKYPSGTVIHCGNRMSATQYIVERGADSSWVVGYTATAGDCGTATAGYGGTATAGYGGTATAGDRGTATAGDRGTATAGDRGTATAGYRGTATAGDWGTVVVRYWDERTQCMRLAVGYVGEDGLQANQPYHVEGGKLVPVNDEAQEGE
jgi:hypothetical protein